MGYTLGAAARATGKSKATISRAIKSGRLSAARDGADGYVIDPAELHRVYPATDDTTGTVKLSEPVAQPGSDTVALERLIAEQAETIRDLRERLTFADEERRRLTTLLTHRQNGSVPAVQAAMPSIGPPAPGWLWWRRLFR
jgi:hypothetical protein